MVSSNAGSNVSAANTTLAQAGIVGPVLKGTHLYHQHANANGKLSAWHWVTDSHAYTVAGHNATTTNPYYGKAPVAVKANGMPYKGAASAMAAQPALSAAQLFNTIVRPQQSAMLAAQAQAMAALQAQPASTGKRKAA